MAGVLAHFASGDSEVLDVSNKLYSESYRKSYVIGLILPDLAKKGFINTKDDLERLFDGCDKEDIISWDEFEKYKKINHFNPMKGHPELQDSANPNLNDFIAAEFVDMKKPVWKAIFCHLYLDKAFYYKTYCTDTPKAMEDWTNSGHDPNDLFTQIWRDSEYSKDWYYGYDILDEWIEEEFKIIKTVGNILSPELLDELLKKFNIHVKKIEGEPKYMNLDNMKKCIYVSRLLARQTDEKSIEKIIRFFNMRDEEQIPGDEELTCFWSFFEGGL